MHWHRCYLSKKKSESFSIACSMRATSSPTCWNCPPSWPPTSRLTRRCSGGHNRPKDESRTRTQTNRHKSLPSGDGLSEYLLMSPRKSGHPLCVFFYKWIRHLVAASTSWLPNSTEGPALTYPDNLCHKRRTSYGVGPTDWLGNHKLATLTTVFGLRHAARSEIRGAQRPG